MRSAPILTSPFCRRCRRVGNRARVQGGEHKVLRIAKTTMESYRCSCANRKSSASRRSTSRRAWSQFWCDGLRYRWLCVLQASPPRNGWAVLRGGERAGERLGLGYGVDGHGRKCRGAGGRGEAVLQRRRGQEEGRNEAVHGEQGHEDVHQWLGHGDSSKLWDACAEGHSLNRVLRASQTQPGRGLGEGSAQVGHNPVYPVFELQAPAMMYTKQHVSLSRGWRAEDPKVYVSIMEGPAQQTL